MVESTPLSLQQQQTLGVLMTPQLQQAIKILQLSSLEIEEFINQELEKNPFLEKESDTSAPEEENYKIEDEEFVGREEMKSLFDDGEQMEFENNEEDSSYEQQKDNFTEYDFSVDSYSGTKGKNDDDDFSALDLCIAPTSSFSEYIIRQIKNLPIEQQKIAFSIFEKTDENGYICEDLTPEETLLLPVMQKMSPSGVFARNLAECLAIQLKELDRFDPAMEIMIQNLPLLANKEYQKLSKLCGVDMADINDMIQEIKLLSPKPAADFTTTAPIDIVPDVLLRQKSSGQFVIELNQAVLPKVLINKSFVAEVSAFHDKASKKFMKEHLTEANFLIKALNQRAETLLKVATCIVEKQKDFFRSSDGVLKPMILKDVATECEIHESTVSRAVNQKYIATAKGVFELKYFFTQAVNSENSSLTIKDQIKKLIDNEKPEHVLSDDDLVEELGKMNITIARRTVAKYRDALKIPTSAQRKRDKRLSAMSAKN